MQIEKVLESEYVTEKQIGEEFYFVASSEENSTLLKKLFLKLDYKNKFTSSVLTYGLLATLELNLDKNFTIIKQFMDKNNIAIDSDILTNGLTHPLEGKEELSFSAISKFMIDNNVQPDRYRMVDYILNLIESKQSITTMIDFWNKTGLDIDKDLTHLQVVYNCANECGNIQLAQQLDEKFGIIKASMNENMGEDIIFAQGAHSSWGSLKEDGTLSICGAAGGELDKQTQRVLHYKLNPFLFNLNHFNTEKLNTLFKEDTTISDSLVTHAVVRSIAYRNMNAMLYLFSQPQCKEIIKNSQVIKAFINSDEDFPEIKPEARIKLSEIAENSVIEKNKFKP